MMIRSTRKLVSFHMKKCAVVRPAAPPWGTESVRPSAKTKEISPNEELPHVSPAARLRGGGMGSNPQQHLGRPGERFPRRPCSQSRGYRHQYANGANLPDS